MLKHKVSADISIVLNKLFKNKQSTIINAVNMAPHLSGQELALIASYFEERVETITLKNGGTAFIQRPKPKAKGSLRSVGDLPDVFDVASIAADNIQIYRVSIGPIDIVFNYDATNMGIEVVVNLNLPFIGAFEIGKVAGNLEEGVSIKIGYKSILSGEVGVRLDGNSVIIYWEFTAFTATYKDEITLFNI